MTRPLRPSLAALGALLCAAPALAAGKPNSLLPGSTGKEPISVDAAKLDYFDKEQKLVYSGGVVARQGVSTLKGSTITIFLSKDAKKASVDQGDATAGAAASGSSIDRMEVAGPVTVISKDEVGTGDSGLYEKASNLVTLSGNVTLTQGTNIIKGDKLVYDMDSGQAHVSSSAERRVTSVFTPQSGGAGGLPKPGKPAPAKAGAPTPLKPPKAADKTL